MGHSTLRANNGPSAAVSPHTVWQGTIPVRISLECPQGSTACPSSRMASIMYSTEDTVRPSLTGLALSIPETTEGSTVQKLPGLTTSQPVKCDASLKMTAHIDLEGYQNIYWKLTANCKCKYKMILKNTHPNMNFRSVRL